MKKPTAAQPKRPKHALPAGPVLRAQYFPTTARVTEEIAAWAEREGVRIRAVLPVYWEGV